MIKFGELSSEEKRRFNNEIAKTEKMCDTDKKVIWLDDEDDDELIKACLKSEKEIK